MPPVETEADRASFFKDDEFAQSAEIRGETVFGFFDESSELAEGLGPVPVETIDPTFTCSSADLPDDIAEGEPITITRDDGSAFVGTVVREEPDGFGMSVLQLQDDE